MAVMKVNFPEEVEGIRADEFPPGVIGMTVGSGELVMRPRYINDKLVCIDGSDSWDLLSVGQSSRALRIKPLPDGTTITIEHNSD